MKRAAFALLALCLLAGTAFLGLRRQTVPHQSFRDVDGLTGPYLAGDSSAAHPYSLAFVEFDDQGFFWDPRQLETAVEHVRKVAADRGAVIVVFMHGWNHNASGEDSNVACFREVLKAASLMQRANHARRPDDARVVVGVYLGWRGLVFEPGWLNQALTFWNRVEVADRIGARGDILRALTAMRDIRATVEPDRTRLIIVGHSMGARALFASLSPFYKEHAFRAGSPVATRPRWDVSTEFGDLVVLVNPAFSASDYRPIDGAARIAYADSRRDTDPNLLIVSSRADWATRDHYPRAQRLSSTFQSFRSDDDRALLATTIGNHEPFITHRLTVESGTVPAFQPLPGECPYLEAEQLGVIRGQARAARMEDLFRYDRIEHFAATVRSSADNVAYVTVLEPKDPAAPRYGPFMVVSADSVLMPGHNEIFTPGFVDFLVRVVNKKTRLSGRP